MTTTGPTIDLIASGDEQDLLFEPAPELKKASRAKKVYWYAIYNGSKVGIVKGHMSALRFRLRRPSL